MKAGSLRHFIDFESPLTSQDSDGALIEDWAPEYARIPASIEPLSGRELIAAAAVNAKVTTRIVCRYLPTVQAAWRVTHRDVIYNLEAVIPDRTGIGHLTLLCSSGVNEG